VAVEAVAEVAFPNKIRQFLKSFYQESLLEEEPPITCNNEGSLKLQRLIFGDFL
jgi:hypothetical protein